ncbi:hypothetical protein E2C01_102318 [Portunus trituberculatus]|uniref:Uncharacterized protein n=1 Tax=Portunus trituberculatus TaxID=210409 RepID=A0A5B7KI26_PORTR|nr:hypothetical protein [Portunus trituberculatus]
MQVRVSRKSGERCGSRWVVDSVRKPTRAVTMEMTQEDGKKSNIQASFNTYHYTQTNRSSVRFSSQQDNGTAAHEILNTITSINEQNKPMNQ